MVRYKSLRDSGDLLFHLALTVTNYLFKSGTLLIYMELLAMA